MSERLRQQVAPGAEQLQPGMAESAPHGGNNHPGFTQSTPQQGGQQGMAESAPHGGSDQPGFAQSAPKQAGQPGMTESAPRGGNNHPGGTQSTLQQEGQPGIAQSTPHQSQQLPQQGPLQQAGQEGYHPPTHGINALVFGASGITGYALMDSLLSYPTPQTFSRIIGLTNRPLSREASLLPPDGRIEIFNGMDLLNREQSLAQLHAIPGIDQVTHVYFASYAGHGSSYEELRKTNEELLTNAVGGVEICCPNLRFFTLQTGGKAYGVEFKDKVPYNAPLQESAPRIPEPYAQNIFYYPQHDIMLRASAGKPWTFCEIRPDAIVGFVPQNNAMGIAQALGLFLSLWKELEVDGNAPRAVPFPGSIDAWTALHTDTSQDILARFHIYASLHPSEVAETAFNVADGPATTWEAVWPQVCQYFGLRGAGPSPSPLDAKAWVLSHQSTWDAWAQKHGLKEGTLQATGFDFMQQVLSIPFRRDYDLTRSRQIGFTEERPHVEGYVRSFEQMRRAKIIP